MEVKHMKKLASGLLILCFILCICAAVQAEAATLTFDTDSLTLSVGRYITMTATVSPYGAIREGATYSVSDDSIASVDKAGKVRGLKAGECMLTAVSKYDETVSVTIPVTIIQPAKKVELTAGDSGVAIGGTLQLSAVLSPEDTTIQTITFSSSNESILTVDADGLVTGISRGTATVTATSGDGKASDKLRITVKQSPEFVTVSPDTLSLVEGKTGQLQADVSPSDADDKSVLWTSLDESIATVSARGLVTGVSYGDTVIIATCKDNKTPRISFWFPCTSLPPISRLSRTAIASKRATLYSCAIRSPPPKRPANPYPSHRRIRRLRPSMNTAWLRHCERGPQTSP